MTAIEKQQQILELLKKIPADMWVYSESAFADQRFPLKQKIETLFKKVKVTVKADIMSSDCPLIVFNERLDNQPLTDEPHVAFYGDEYFHHLLQSRRLSYKNAIRSESDKKIDELHKYFFE